MNFKPFSLLKRCKSECDLLKTNSYDYRKYSLCSESSVADSASEFGEDKRNGDEISALETKIDRLNGLFLEHCSLLAEVKEEIRDSKTMIERSEQAQNKFIAELLRKALTERPQESEPSEFNARARSLLDAIETKQVFCLERELRDTLADFLQSDELKQHMVCATVESLRAELRDSFSRDISRLYLPLLQRAHRQLARQVQRALDEGFAELEANTTQLSMSMCRVSRSLRRALERHQALLETDAEASQRLKHMLHETLQKEMQQWRERAVDALCSFEHSESDQQWVERGATPPLEIPDSPPQPAQPGCSIIDQLMKTAEINKDIQDGHVDSAFERALSAADLSLVVAACRAADPAMVFTPCRLSQTTLLSLAQQLTTDMVHETQLKCRYLEEALIHLNPIHPATRIHLPMIVGEIRKHLTKFLSKYPSHVANRRIMLIIMAADNLLK